MFHSHVIAIAIAIIFLAPLTAAQAAQITIKTGNGALEGAMSTEGGIRVFLGVPFAQPPVGKLRWKAPQPPSSWKGVRKATAFGPRPMQPAIYDDMVFRSPNMSEDCLYLNIWAPSQATGDNDKLPVLVYFYGGGFVAGSADEPRYDGENMARKGIVVITVNYRLGIFGFFAHPELTKESPNHACGNYGMLDQSAALHWVHKIISAFGGDPRRVTIGGESAGSYSVSLQMASPLSRDLIAGAIFGRTITATNLLMAEHNGASFAAETGAPSLTALRALSGQKLLETTRANPFRFSIINDGYFLPGTAEEIYGAGKQAHVPLLAGWNSMESPGSTIMGQNPVTLAAFAKVVKGMYGEQTSGALLAYNAKDDSEVMDAATALASDRFIGYGTWKWIDLHGRTCDKPVYRYLFSRARPGEAGSFHAVDIEYALGNLDKNHVYKWTDDDRKVSAAMLDYFANFIKTGDPNGPDLPLWPAANLGGDAEIMHLDVDARAESERHRDRYLFLDKIQYGASK